MPLMSLERVRVVDPILTTVVQGYIQSEFVGDALFPPVPVASRSGLVVEFGKEDFALFDTRRAPGAATKRRNINYGTRRYSLYQDRLEGELPVEHIQESAGINLNLQSEAAESTMRSIELRKEYDQAAIATNASSYDAAHKVTLSGTSQFSDSTSKPSSSIRSWRQAVRATTGVFPNVWLMGPRVLDYLAEHNEIKDKVKYTSSNSITTDAIAEMYGFESVKVGSALILNAGGTFTDLWGDVCILAYVPQGRRSVRSPSFGYTYTLEGYPMAEKPYWDNNHATWYFPVTAERSPEMTGPSSGFIAQNVVVAA